jgi:hypothetical protein
LNELELNQGLSILLYSSVEKEIKNSRMSMNNYIIGISNTPNVNSSTINLSCI